MTAHQTSQLKNIWTEKIKHKMYRLDVGLVDALESFD